MHVEERFPVPREWAGEEARALGETVRRWAEREIREKRPGLRGQPLELLVPALRGLLVDLGLQYAVWPEAHGGFGQAQADHIASLVLALEELGRAGADLALTVAVSQALAGTIVSGEDRLPPGHEPWIVKFAAREDGEDAGAVEQVYATMAREAGIAVPETRLFETAQGDRFFGARRFDREGDRRRHVHTFAGMIHADYRIPSVDYADLLKVVRALTRDHQQLVEAVRRVAFNVSSHNRDDHTKNISFVLDDENGEWTLAPAYDLTFAYGPGGEHSMTLHGEGRRPTADHVRALAKSVGLATHEVEDVLERVRAAVARWDERAADAGVSDDRRQEIGAAMARVVRR